MIAVAISAAMAGSPSGGLNIALSNLSEHFLSLGINPGVIHRVSVVASGSLDSLPSCATLINELNQACLTQRESYYNILLAVHGLALDSVLYPGIPRRHIWNRLTDRIHSSQSGSASAPGTLRSFSPRLRSIYRRKQNGFQISALRNKR